MNSPSLNSENTRILNKRITAEEVAHSDIIPRDAEIIDVEPVDD